MIGAVKQDSGRKHYQSDIMQTEKHNKSLDNESDIMGHHFLKVKLQRGHLRKDGTSLQRPISTKTSSLQRRHISAKTTSLQ
jgi:polyribonucleotide nucleotidyltransferase